MKASNIAAVWGAYGRGKPAIQHEIHGAVVAGSDSPRARVLRGPGAIGVDDRNVYWYVRVGWLRRSYLDVQSLGLVTALVAQAGDVALHYRAWVDGAFPSEGTYPQVVQLRTGTPAPARAFVEKALELKQVSDEEGRKQRAESRQRFAEFERREEEERRQLDAELPYLCPECSAPGGALHSPGCPVGERMGEAWKRPKDADLELRCPFCEAIPEFEHGKWCRHDGVWHGPSRSK
jgi:hypothetical protein